MRELVIRRIAALLVKPDAFVHYPGKITTQKQEPARLSKGIRELSQEPEFLEQEQLPVWNEELAPAKIRYWRFF